MGEYSVLNQGHSPKYIGLNQLDSDALINFHAALILSAVLLCHFILALLAKCLLIFRKILYPATKSIA